jgi:hypothetical protein
MILIDYLYCTVWNRDIDIDDLVFVTVYLTFSSFSELKIVFGTKIVLRLIYFVCIIWKTLQGVAIYKYMYTEDEGRAL